MDYSDTLRCYQSRAGLHHQTSQLVTDKVMIDSSSVFNIFLLHHPLLPFVPSNSFVFAVYLVTPLQHGIETEKKNSCSCMYRRPDQKINTQLVAAHQAEMLQTF